MTDVQRLRVHRQDALSKHFFGPAKSKLESLRKLYLSCLSHDSDLKGNFESGAIWDVGACLEISAAFPPQKVLDVEN